MGTKYPNILIRIKQNNKRIKNKSLVLHVCTDFYLGIDFD